MAVPFNEKHQQPILEAGLTNDYLPEVMTDRAIIDTAPELILG